MKSTRRSPGKSSSSSTGSGAKKRRKPGRNVIVLASLMGSLVLTSALLLALSPAPLAPNAQSLVATEVQDGLGPVFADVQVQPGRWKRVYVHHTRSRRGNAYDGVATGDHFLIGNGDGCVDGEIQIGHRWVQQQQATVAGSAVTNDCISICLVGDFNVKAPTAKQMLALERLVAALQRNLRIPGRAVVVDEKRGDVMGVGRQFPAQAFRARLEP